MVMLTTIAPTADPDTAPTTASSSAMTAGLAGVFFFLLLLLLLFACRPWRFFHSFFSSAHSLPSSYRPASAKVDNLERPLLSGNVDNSSRGSYDVPGNFLDSAEIQIDGNMTSPKVQRPVRKKQFQPTDSCASQVATGDSLVLNISSDASQDCQIHTTRKSSAIPSWSVDEIKQIQGDFSYDVGKCRNLFSVFTKRKSLRSSLTLEVIAGPSCGLYCSRESADTSMLPLTLGRVSPSDLLFKDSEVSGKHACINWNMNSLKWELVDKGSLNGTFLNTRAINRTDFGSRNWSEPVELADGDVITLGTSAKISVKISQYSEHEIPPGVGMACDSMYGRRGGKRLPMEDMCCFHCPLIGAEQFGLFGIFDGHGGAEAAKVASQMLPDTVASILSRPERRANVLSLCDASDILRDAFTCTEATMTHQYEGCTATVLLIWSDNDKGLFAQCANVGDSACFINVDGEIIPMTEDHRVASATERTRLIEAGKPLKDGETRLCGLNICRMLGDKFLKEHDERFSSKPYISRVVAIEKTCTAFALMASDGLWDVISMKKAVQLVLQAKQKSNCEEQNSADMIANDVLMAEARNLKTKDNTTVIFIDFDVLRTDSCTIEV